MGAVLFISLGILLFLSLPLLTMAYARSLGRDPKLWFFIGILLPGLSTLILSIMPNPRKTEKVENGE
jgi:hypothetical protein